MIRLADGSDCREGWSLSLITACSNAITVAVTLPGPQRDMRPDLNLSQCVSDAPRIEVTS